MVGANDFLSPKYECREKYSIGGESRRVVQINLSL
jgi:hypothetical protein